VQAGYRGKRKSHRKGTTFLRNTPKTTKKLPLFNFRLRGILTLRAIDAPCADEAGFSGTKRPPMSTLLTKYNRLKDSQLDNKKPALELLDTEVVTWRGL
jgi:hypothetical protein